MGDRSVGDGGVGLRGNHRSINLYDAILIDGSATI